VTQLDPATKATVDLLINQLNKKYYGDVLLFGSHPRSMVAPDTKFSSPKALGYDGRVITQNRSDIDFIVSNDRVLLEMATILSMPNFVQVAVGAKGKNNWNVNLTPLETKMPEGYQEEDKDSPEPDNEWDKLINEIVSQDPSAIDDLPGWYVNRTSSKQFPPGMVDSRWKLTAGDKYIFDVAVSSRDGLEVWKELHDKRGDFTANFLGIYKDDIVAIDQSYIDDAQKLILRRIDPKNLMINTRANIVLSNLRKSGWLSPDDKNKERELIRDLRKSRLFTSPPTLTVGPGSETVEWVVTYSGGVAGGTANAQ